MGMINKEIPDTTSGMNGLSKNVMQEGELSVAEKEAIALGIAVAIRCKACIRIHVKGCLKKGLTRKQILEAASVAVMMAGGAAYTHLAEVIEAIDTFTE
jgi:AhpD family alkylhydroperoxidase